MSKSTQRDALGFTLIEMLVTISVIALLVAILMPVLSKTRETARRILCASNLHQQGIGMMVYADTNNGKLFTHRNSIASPGYVSWSPTSAYYPEGNEFVQDAYIPYERRETGPSANHIAAAPPTGGNWPWDQLGGPKGDGGFFDGLYPHIMASPDVFDCPSVYYYAWSNMGGYAGWEPALRFGTNLAPYYRGETAGGTYFVSYAGNVFGRVDRPHKKYGHGFWSTYFIQGYYPYDEAYRSSYGTLLWDMGSRAFWLANTGTVTMANHRVGGNELYIDGSVKWRNYPWIAAE
jgi:prepilin-type N-terminal cleavage/methylation domain-containing protein